MQQQNRDFTGDKKSEFKDASIIISIIYNKLIMYQNSEMHKENHLFSYMPFSTDHPLTFPSTGQWHLTPTQPAPATPPPRPPAPSTPPTTTPGTT